MGKRAIIIGAGIGGLASAIALRKVGYSVQVFERTAEVRGIGSGLSLWSNAMWALYVLGVSDEVLRLGSVVDITRSQTADGEVLSDVHVGTIARKLGVPTVCIHRADLHQILLRAAGAEHVQTSVPCVGFTQDSQGVTCSSPLTAFTLSSVVSSSDPRSRATPATPATAPSCRSSTAPCPRVSPSPHLVTASSLGCFPAAWAESTGSPPTTNRLPSPTRRSVARVTAWPRSPASASRSSKSFTPPPSPRSCAMMSTTARRWPTGEKAASLCSAMPATR